MKDKERFLSSCTGCRSRTRTSGAQMLVNLLQHPQKPIVTFIYTRADIKIEK